MEEGKHLTQIKRSQLIMKRSMKEDYGSDKEMLEESAKTVQSFFSNEIEFKSIPRPELWPLNKIVTFVSLLGTYNRSLYKR
jgi:hypothetical protein